MSINNVSLPASVISHAMATSLDYFIKGNLKPQSITDKPLLQKMETSAETFTGGRDYISVGVKMNFGAGGTNDTVIGVGGNDAVAYYNPANGLRAQYPWQEHWIGISITETELKAQGVLISDATGKPTGGMAKTAAQVLAPVLGEAMRDLTEQWQVGMWNLMWGDGTTDPKALSGIRSIIQDVPTEGVVGGLSAAVHPAWRNRAYTSAFSAASSFDAAYGGGAVTSSTSNGGALIQLLQQEWRKLSLYGGKPDCFFAGSDFIGALETELRANGTYTQTGFAGKMDASMGGLFFMGVPIVYEPWLDLNGRAKYAYIWDSRHIRLHTLKGDWKRARNPARPYDRHVFYTGITSTGQIVCDKRNTSLVVQIN